MHRHQQAKQMAREGRNNTSTAAAFFATAALSAAQAGRAMPYTSASKMALACMYAACHASSGLNTTAVGKRLGGDQNIVPLLVRASSGKVYVNCTRNCTSSKQKQSCASDKAISKHATRTSWALVLA
jgi:hypothetical protein